MDGPRLMLSPHEQADQAEVVHHWVSKAQGQEVLYVYRQGQSGASHQHASDHPDL